MLNRKMAKAAGQVIVVTDRSKFGRVCLHRILNVGEIDDLVTDAVEADGLQAAAGRLGFRLHVAWRRISPPVCPSLKKRWAFFQ